MISQNHIPARIRSVGTLIAGALIATTLTLGAAGSAGASQSLFADDINQVDRASQQVASQGSTAFLGVALPRVSSDAVVYTPDAVLAGPIGVESFVDSIQDAHPNAQFDVTSTLTVNNFTMVDWHGTVDGMAVSPGRTMFTIEGGLITDIWFLSLHDLAPIQGEPGSSAGSSSYFVIVDDQGNAIAPEASVFTGFSTDSEAQG